MKNYPIKVFHLVSLFLSLCFFVVSAHAAPGAIIESMQMPAWIQRDDMKSPLKPGMEINSGDMIISGENSRVLITLMDGGSQVKIGEKSKVRFERIQPGEEDEGFFEGFIHIYSGTMRYTTTESSMPHPRDLEIRVGAITVSLSGTDIWMQAAIGVDNLVLIEGSIKASREGEPEFVMEQPLSWYQVPENKPAQLIDTIPQDKLAHWAAETELLPGAGVVSRKGSWLVNLISLRNEKTLLKKRLELAHQGVMSTVNEAIIKGKKWYRLGVKGFVTKTDAEMFAQMIEGRYGLSRPWINRL